MGSSQRVCSRDTPVDIDVALNFAVDIDVALNFAPGHTGHIKAANALARESRIGVQRRLQRCQMHKSVSDMLFY
jgi:hypothetical protein